MKFTIIISQDHPEIVWNAFRLANLILSQNDEVVIFLNGPSVNYRRLHSERFPILDLARKFVSNKGIFNG